MGRKASTTTDPYERTDVEDRTGSASPART